jgi:hypothetical protein
MESLDAISRTCGGRWRMQLDPEQIELQGCLPRGRWQLGHGGFGEGSRWWPRGKRGQCPWERQGRQLEDEARRGGSSKQRRLSKQRRRLGESSPASVQRQQPSQQQSKMRHQSSSTTQSSITASVEGSSRIAL